MTITCRVEEIGINFDYQLYSNMHKYVFVSLALNEPTDVDFIV